ncbi:biotin synthase BioB [Peptostreptococcus equinus]|uniref:Multifunctional fusion protein n=1 Tax=Peptostreptococcus equinus TaxID=3003601 RepID=A0ABY7JPT7_9FIRM|nr:biotin synthase BioB [Peptostreptococcus sp. CBA3647]WAW15388.1 biotin synthase BioB [Peptostreptococcus sp. CBA3647]
MEDNLYNLKAKKLKDMVINGYEVDLDDIEILKYCDLNILCELACQIRDALSDGEFDLCTIINGKSGNCSENCSFCAQSSHHNVTVDKYDILEKSEIVNSAIKNYNNKINRFSIVTSGRSLKDKELIKLCNTFEEISLKCPINLCSSNGLLTYEQLLRLKKAGVSRYHNNLETSKSFFSNICTTHTYDDKVKTIKAAQKAGLKICSGGIFGLGENLDHRIEMALDLRKLNVDSVPINILNPISNTPLENNKILNYDEIIRSISIFRFILPHKNIRLAGGRILLDDNGLKAINSGVDSMISGDMLTTSGINPTDDIKTIESMGFSIKKTNDNGILEDHISNISQVLLEDTNSDKKAIFISGANTDIGKTYISGEICSILKDSNIDVTYYKPVLSGAHLDTNYDNNNLIAGDCKYVIERSNLNKKPNELCSYIFRQAYSPHLASFINEKEISLDIIKNDFFDLYNKSDYTIVEGCGGIVCPIHKSQYKLIMQTDIIKMLNIDIILVIGSDLGSINQAVTTFEYCINMNINVRAIIMNKFDTTNIKHIDNKKMIEQLTDKRVFYCE